MFIWTPPPQPHNVRHYHLQKYWPFLLNHPVYWICKAAIVARLSAQRISITPPLKNESILNRSDLNNWIHFLGSRPSAAQSITTCQWFPNPFAFICSLHKIHRMNAQWQSCVRLSASVSLSFRDITYVVQQDTQLLLWLSIYSQYVWQLDMFRTYRSIFRSIYKLCVAGLVCVDCVLLGASIR